MQVAIWSCARSRATRIPSGRKGNWMTTSLPSLASSRPSLYIPFGSSALVSTKTGPSVREESSRSAFRCSTPAAFVPATESHTPSRRPRSLIRRASSALALSRNNRMAAGFYIAVSTLAGRGGREGAGRLFPFFRLLVAEERHRGAVLASGASRLLGVGRNRQRRMRLVLDVIRLGELCRRDGSDVQLWVEQAASMAR